MLLGINGVGIRIMTMTGNSIKINVNIVMNNHIFPVQKRTALFGKLLRKPEENENEKGSRKSKN